MTRYFYDWEFLEDGVTIAPISIGIVSEDGDREYYAIFYSAPWDRIEHHAWLIENVVTHLPRLPAGAGMGDFPSGRLGVDLDHPDVKSRYVIAAEVRQFLTGARNRHPVELWGYYSSYDHVLLAQLWGRMVDLPPGVPMITLDVQQEALRRGLENSLPKQAGDLHNALADARWIRDTWRYLNGKGAPRYCSACGNTLASHAYTWCPGTNHEGK